MAIKINHFIKPDFPDGEDEAIEYLANKSLNFAPKNQPFHLYKLLDKMNLSVLEKRQFNHLLTEIRNYLIESDYVFVTSNNMIKMNKTKETKPLQVNQTINMGDNHGVLDLSSNSQNTNKTKHPPNIKPATMSSVQKMWVFFNSKLMLLIVGLVIEEVTVGAIWKFIISFF